VSAEGSLGSPRRAVLPAVVLVVALALAGCSGASASGGVAGDAAGATGDVSALLASSVLLDVRTPAEHAAGHVAGALLIDVTAPDFADRVAELDRDARYLVYCRSGNRSKDAIAIMAGLGFTDLVDGGAFTDLVAAGAPAS
jgi:phage shock protein E